MLTYNVSVNRSLGTVVIGSAAAGDPLAVDAKEIRHMWSGFRKFRTPVSYIKTSLNNNNNNNNNNCTNNNIHYVFDYANYKYFCLSCDEGNRLIYHE
jgi:hypothetical protein